MNSNFHLAQLNLADSKADLNSDIMRGFSERLDEINALAENTDGFIWRYKDEEGEAEVIRVFNSPSLIINMTVWKDIDLLRHFVYKTTHKELIKGRKAWFHKIPEINQVLWWISIGHTPTLAEANQKLELIRQHGSTENAFSFAKPFEPTT